MDGLRAIAIAMVFAYHVDKGVVPAGYWGVVVFFVLSGYLITRLLVAERDQTGTIDLRRFYLQRALRLLPVLIVVAIAAGIAGGRWPVTVPAIGHYSNYARIGGFDMGLLTHTWFLAVLLHFYVLWPLVITAVPPRHRTRVIAGLAVAAIAWRVAAIGIMSPAWVYNATDTNAAAILAGCYLAVARPRPWRLARWAVPGLLVLMVVPVFGESGSAFLWGDFIAIALGVLAVSDAVDRRSWLSAPVIVRLGTISYGLYLWHYVFLRDGVPAWGALPLTIVTAAATWYLLEVPLTRWRRRLDERATSPKRVRGSGDGEDPAAGGPDLVDASHRAA